MPLTLRLPPSAWDFLHGFIARSFAHVSTLLLMLYAARHLSPELFGAYALGSLAAALSAVFLYSGVYEFLLRTDDLPGQSGSAFTWLLGIGVVFSVAHLAFAHVLGWMLNSPELPQMLIVFAVIPLLSAPSAWREAIYLRDPANLKAYYRILIARDVSGLLVGAVLLYLGQGLTALVVYRVYVSMVTYMMFYVVVPDQPVL